MPVRHGNTYRALGWLITTCLCLVLAQTPALGQTQTTESERNPPPVKEAKPEPVTEPANHQDKGQAERPKSEEPTPTASGRIAKPIDPDPTEPKPDTRDTEAQNELSDIARRDLTAQQIMAKFTRQLAIAGWIALGITSLGVLLIWRTLVYTSKAAGYAKDMVEEAAKTTVAAVNTAEEARRQADIAALSMIRLERPYLFPEIVKPDREKHGGNYKAFLRYRFKNHGRTPAVLRSVSVRLESVPKMPLRLPLVVNTDVYEVVSPGASTEERRVYVHDTFLYEPWNGVEATKLIFHGSISYGDVAGAQHTDYFCLRANENAKGFVMDGGETYNRRTSIGPSMEIERPEE